MQNGISKCESLNYISAGNFVDKTISRFAEIGVPTNLSKYGIFLHDLDHIVGIMATQQAAFDQNPIHFSVDKDFAEFMTKYLEK